MAQSAEPLPRGGNRSALFIGLLAAVVGLAGTVVWLVIQKKKEATAPLQAEAGKAQPVVKPRVEARIEESTGAAVRKVEPREEAAPESAFTKIFNEGDLTGWSGDPELWRVENGALAGRRAPVEGNWQNSHIHWTNGQPRDFELRFAFQIFRGNSGLVYRSEDFGNRSQFGYEFVVTDQTQKFSYCGQLFESGAQGSRPKWHSGRGHLGTPGSRVRVEPGRRIVADGVPASTREEALAAVRLNEWNEGAVLAVGNRMIHRLNGTTITEVTDQDVGPSRLAGAIGFKLSPGAEIHLKAIRLREIAPAAQDVARAAETGRE